MIKPTKSLLLIVTGLLLIAAAFVLVVYNLWDADRAAKASGRIAEELEARIDDRREYLPETSGENGLPGEEIDGYLYVGLLEIPEFDLELPVMASWDYERLRLSPCLYSGSYLTDDMVICAHNYARHFSPVKRIRIGSDIYFTSVDGQSYHYLVSNRETVEPKNVEDMIDSGKGDWDLTLFTCNTGGQTRCAVRCVRAE